MKRSLLLLSLLLSQTVVADEDVQLSVEDPQLGRPVDFDQDIRPILQANCTACHNVSDNEAGVIVESVESMLKSEASSPVLVPGKPEESLLFTLSRRGVDSSMPPLPNDRQANSLTPKQLGTIRQWIAEGAKAGTGAAKAMNWQPISSALQGVYALDVSNNGRFIAAGRANFVTVYDLHQKETTQRLVDPEIISSASQGPMGAAHRDFVHAVAFHPGVSRPIIATSGYRNVKLWQRDQSAVTAAFAVPAEATHWQPSTDGNEVFAVIPGRGVAVLNAASGAERGVAAVEGGTATALSTLNSAGLIIAALADNRIAVIRSTDLQTAAVSEPLPAAVTAFSSELAGGRLATLLADGSVRLLTVAADSGAVAIAAEVRSDAGEIRLLQGNGTHFLTVTGPRTVQIWKADDAAQSARFDAPADLTSVAIHTAAQRLLMISAEKSFLFNTADNKQIAELTAPFAAQQQLKQAEHSKSVLDARVAVIKGQIDAATKEVEAQKEAEKKAREEVEKQKPIQAEAKTKYDEAAAKTAEARKASEAAADNEELKKALAEAEKAEAPLKDALTKADADLSTANKSVDFAVQAIVRAEQRVADRQAAQEAATAEATAASARVEEQKSPAAAVVQSVAGGFVAAGSLAVTAAADGSLSVWETATGTPVDLLPGTQVNAQVQQLQTSGNHVFLKTADNRLLTRPALPEWSLWKSIGSEENPDSPFADRVLALAFSPDGSKLATGGGEASRSGELMIWDVETGTLAGTFPDAHSDTVYGVEFSADGHLLASASADKFVKVFDLKSGEFVRSFEGHTHHVMDVSWKADRTALASAGADNAIKIWNAETGEQSRTIATYQRQVTSLQYVGLQDQIVSSSGDKRVFLHNPANGQATREFKGNGDYVYRSTTTPDGKLVISGGEDGTVRVWNAADAAVIATFEAGGSD
jgi:WD40 repeat protein